MRNTRLFMLFAVLLFSVAMVSMALAADKTQLDNNHSNPPPVTQSWLPETLNGIQPPAQAHPTNRHNAINSQGLLYMTSVDTSSSIFAVYDPNYDTWTTLNTFNTGCQMAVSMTGELYAYNYDNTTIDVYDPTTDSWTMVIGAPPGSLGQYCNLEITNDNEFVYTEGNSTTLWYTSLGVWQTYTLPFTTNLMGDYDPIQNQYVVGEWGTTNAHLVNMDTWDILNYYSTVGNGEWARFGVILNDRYYFEAGGSDIFSFDLSNPASPPMDHGVVPGWYNSAAADRNNGVIYTASLDGDTLYLFDPTINELTSLTGYSTLIWHSSLAFAAPLQPPYFVTFLPIVAKN
jgi:hypothetical protein